MRQRRSVFSSWQTSTARHVAKANQFLALLLASSKSTASCPKCQSIGCRVTTSKPFLEMLPSAQLTFSFAKTLKEKSVKSRISDTSRISSSLMRLESCQGWSSGRRLSWTSFTTGGCTCSRTIDTMTSTLITTPRTSLRKNKSKRSKIRTEFNFLTV